MNFLRALANEYALPQPLVFGHEGPGVGYIDPTAIETRADAALERLSAAVPESSDR